MTIYLVFLAINRVLITACSTYKKINFDSPKLISTDKVYCQVGDKLLYHF